MSERAHDRMRPFSPSLRALMQSNLDAFERRYVERILAAHDGNVSHAARASGLALRYFRLVKARQQKI